MPRLPPLDARRAEDVELVDNLQEQGRDDMERLGLKDVVWVVSSLDNLKEFPESVGQMMNLESSNDNLSSGTRFAATRRTRLAQAGDRPIGLRL